MRALRTGNSKSASQFVEISTTEQLSVTLKLMQIYEQLRVSISQKS
jgi:hypothetical protein